VQNFSRYARRQLPAWNLAAAGALVDLPAAAPVQAPGSRPARPTRSIIMSELSEKTKGLGNQIAGKAKVAVADVTDNPKLRVEGEAQKAKGAAQKVAGSVEGALGDKV
jgi:uncharacterized protein YjbJ (UPF0337 family)